MNDVAIKEWYQAWRGQDLMFSSPGPGYALTVVPPGYLRAVERGLPHFTVPGTNADGSIAGVWYFWQGDADGSDGEAT